MERPALFVGDAEEGEATLKESEHRSVIVSPGDPVVTSWVMMEEDSTCRTSLRSTSLTVVFSCSASTSFCYRKEISRVRDRMQRGLPPESAEEYLVRVRIESNDLPAVVEAHVPEKVKKKQTSYMPATEPVSTCAPCFLPDEKWEREVISTFVDLRQYLRRWKATAPVSTTDREPVPALKDNVGWHIFCLGCAEDYGARQASDPSPGHPSPELKPSAGMGTDRGRSGNANGEDAHPSGSSSATASGAASGFPRVSGTARGDGEAAAAERATVARKDPRNDDDAQSSYYAGTVESSARFDRFTSTLAKTTESLQDISEQPTSGQVTSSGVQASSPPPPPILAEAEGVAVSKGVGKGFNETEAEADAGSEEGSMSKRATGVDWLRTHPRGTPPTMKLAMQFDQVLTQRVLAFHADWLRTNLVSRARAVWIYTLLACLEKPLGSETAALVREILRRCCARRAELESPDDDRLAPLNVLVAISGKFFQQAEVA